MKRLLTLSLLLSGTFLFGQISFVDYGPDGLTIAANENMSFDVNDDGVTDFYINKYQDELSVSPIFAVGCFASPSYAAQTSWGARELTAFEEGEVIGLNDSNMFDYIDDDPERGAVYHIDNSLYADGWENDTPRYIGYAVFSGNAVLNGWMKVSVDETNNALILHSTAYNTSNGIGFGEIVAGDTGVTAVSDLEGSAEIAVYPNPSSEVLNVNFHQDVTSQVKVSVVAMNGAVVNQTVVNGLSKNETIRLDVSDLSMGSYLLKLSSDAGVQVKNFMIKR